MTLVRFKPNWQTTNDTRTGKLYNPPVDIVETNDKYALEFDVPGFTKDDINISVNEGVLKLTGERKRTVETEEKYFRHFERPEGTFTRSFRLPDHVDADAITATYTNGVLRLELPKEEEAKPHTIEIK